MGKIRIRDGQNSIPGSGINIPDPPHWHRHLLLGSGENFQEIALLNTSGTSTILKTIRPSQRAARSVLNCTPIGFCKQTEAVGMLVRCFSSFLSY